MATKRAVYKAVVLAVLLYGSETWVLKAQHTRRLNVFHNRCVRAILGVTRYQQWQERLTTQTLAERFGMTWTIPDVVTEHRLKWLGHVGRMDEGRLPKKLLFGELRKTRPNHGTKEEVERSSQSRPEVNRCQGHLVQDLSRQEGVVRCLSRGS